MEKLRELQRKNALLLALRESWATAAPPAEEQTLLAETLLPLLGAFGADTFRRVALLCSHASHLEEATLCKAVEAVGAPVPAPEPVPATVPAPVPAPQPCSVTVEGVDLAQSALEDFMSSYFMFHGLSPDSPKDILRHLPFLGFVEAHIYGLDQANEDNLRPPKPDETWQRAPPLLEDPFGPLRDILQERRWLTPRLERELCDGARFWALERQLCAALAGAGQIERADVEEALRLKSFDYRAMNLLLYAMRGEEPSEAHMTFLATSEVLVELGDDLGDYSEDVETNSFNVYRCFLALYGPEGGPRELAKFIQAAEASYAAALRGLDESLAKQWLDRSQASRRHGAGSERGSGGGTWEIPPPIDERSVR